MGKFNLAGLINEQSKNEGDAFAFKIEPLDIEQIEPSKMNFYTVDDVAELKASIELYGIQQNLVVRKQADGLKYELLSGERRYTAIKQLVAEGKEGFRRVPCKIIKSIDDMQAELQLIFANSTARRLSDYELAHQAKRLNVLLIDLKKSGFKFTGKKREIVAELMKVSESQINRYDSINKNLSPELKEKFKREEINVTTAYELSKLNEEQQSEALEEHQSGAPLTPEAVKQKREAALPPPKPPLPNIVDVEGAETYQRPADSLSPLPKREEKTTAPETGRLLKSCPFCGAYPGLYAHGIHVSIECGECGAGLDGDDKAEAVQKWNRRV